MLVFIGWLKNTGTLDFINALMTVSISGFALVQLMVSARDRRSRMRTALGAFWVEYWRVWTVSERWRKEDLEYLDRAGLFNPDEILPPDWGVVLPLLGELGPMPARLGGLAYSLAAHAAEHGRAFQRLKDTEKILAKQNASAEDFRKLSQLRADAAGHARTKARLAADTFEDALACVPRWAKVMKFDPDLLKSEPGRKLAAQILERNARRRWWHRVRNWFGFSP